MDCTKDNDIELFISIFEQATIDEISTCHQLLLFDQLLRWLFFSVFRWSIELLNSKFQISKKNLKKNRIWKEAFAFDFKVERSALWLTIILILRCTKICYFVLLFSPNWPDQRATFYSINAHCSWACTFG